MDSFENWNEIKHEFSHVVTEVFSSEAGILEDVMVGKGLLQARPRLVSLAHTRAALTALADSPASWRVTAGPHHGLPASAPPFTGKRPSPPAPVGGFSLSPRNAAVCPNLSDQRV